MCLMPVCELTARSSLLRAVISCIRRAVHAVRAADDSAGFQVVQRCDLLAVSRGLRPDYVKGSLSLAPHLLRSSRAHYLSSWAEVLSEFFPLSQILCHPARSVGCPLIWDAVGEAQPESPCSGEALFNLALFFSVGTQLRGVPRL